MSAAPRRPPNPREIRTVCLLIGLVVLILATNAYLLQPQFVAAIEGRLLDERLRFRGPIETSGIVAIAAVDDASIDALGRWPWSRRTLAKLIQAINQAGATTIGLDIIFSESETKQIYAQLDQLQYVNPEVRRELETALSRESPDDVLANTLRTAGNVINGLFFYTSPDQAKGLQSISPTEEAALLAKATVTAVRTKTDHFRVRKAYGVETNIPVIGQAGRGAGHFNSLPGRDGIIRKAPLIMRYRGELYPSLAVKALALYLDDAPVVVYAEDYGITHLSLGGHVIPTNELGEIIINYRGPPKTIPTYAAIDILRGEIPSGALTGKLVFLGVTATGVYDAHSTPLGPSFPGLEIQANVAENLILGDALRRTGVEALIDLATMGLIILLLCLVLPRFDHIHSRTLFSLLVIGVYTAVNYYVFSRLQLWVALVYPLSAWLLTYFFLTLYLTMVVERTSSNVRKMFGSYVHPGVVDKLIEQPELLKFGGEEKELTMLFADIRNFTGISERLTAPQLARFLNCCMDNLSQHVFSNQGTLDKYIGDEIMAIYGAPYPSEQHPKEACVTALAMIKSLPDIEGCCPMIKAKYPQFFPVRIGVGIHTGDTVVGNLGSSYQFNYTAIGDSVNVASRLQGLTKVYKVNIVVSETTYMEVKDDFIFRELDTVQVKGRETPIRIYELRGKELIRDEAEFLDRWQCGLDAFRERRWEDGLSVFEAAATLYPLDEPCMRYAEECRRFISEPPPPDWKPVTSYTTK